MIDILKYLISIIIVYIGVIGFCFLVMQSLIIEDKIEDFLIKLKNKKK